MEIRNKVWEELKFSDVSVRTVLWYTDRQRRWARWYKFVIALIASIGAFGFILNKIIPFISSLIIALTSLLKSLFPQFIQSEQELAELDSVGDYYEECKNILEQLWYKREKEQISEGQLADQIFSLIDRGIGKKTKMNRLLRHIPAKIKEKISNESDTYLNEVYYNIYPEKIKKENAK